jgi:hypothetical protein
MYFYLAFCCLHHKYSQVCSVFINDNVFIFSNWCILSVAVLHVSVILTVIKGFVNNKVYHCSF